MLLLQAVDLPCSFALASAGSNKPARIAIIPITTSSSSSVNPPAPHTRSESLSNGEFCLHITGRPLFSPNRRHEVGAGSLFGKPGFAATVRLTAHLPNRGSGFAQRSRWLRPRHSSFILSVPDGGLICGWLRAAEARRRLCCQRQCSCAHVSP